MTERNATTVRRRSAATPLFYRDAWAFLRKAERAREERDEIKVAAYSRAAILNAVIAAEAFINYHLDHLTVEEDADAQVEKLLARLFETSATAPAVVEYRGLKEHINAVRALRRLKGIESKAADLVWIERVLRRQALELGLDFYRKQSPIEIETLHELSRLRNEFTKREIKGDSVLAKWRRGIEYFALGEWPLDDPIVRKFTELMTKVRGKRMHERPQEMVLNAEGLEESAFLREVSLENAQSACDTVRSMIAGFCGAANLRVPDWVSEVNDEL